MINLTFYRRIDKRYLKFFSVLFLICLIAPAAWAEGPYYIKNGGNNQLDGLSDATAWENFANVDNAGFDSGTDIYVKQGNTITITSDIDINWTGTSGDGVIIGCYESDGDFDCSGARPIIQNTNNNADNFSVTNQQYIRFEHLDIRNSSAYWEDCALGGAGSNAGIGFGGGGYLTVNDCNFYHLGHYAIAVSDDADHNIITNNTFDTVGNAIYFIHEDGDGAGGASYNYIANNTCNNIVGYATCANPGTKLDGHCVGLQAVTHTIVEGNTCKDGDSGVFVVWAWKRDRITNNIVRYNTSYSSRGAALYLVGGGYAPEDSWGNLAYGNVFTGTSEGMDREAIRLSDLTHPNGNRVFNNTIYNAHKQGMGVKDDTAYTYWKNNIVCTDDLSENMFRTQHNPSNLNIDYNLYWTLAADPSSTTTWMDTNLSGYNWTDWTTSRSHDNNSLTPANPNFNAPGSNDFTLQVGSPAIDAGDYLSYVINTSGTSITVGNSYWFHGNYGLVDAIGRPVPGMKITFYDKTYGIQQRIITSDFIKHGTPGIFIVNESIKSIYDSAHLHDPAYTTQVSLRFFGTKPDIGGAKENTGSRITAPSNLKIIF